MAYEFEPFDTEKELAGFAAVLEPWRELDAKLPIRCGKCRRVIGRMGPAFHWRAGVGWMAAIQPKGTFPSSVELADADALDWWMEGAAALRLALPCRARRCTGRYTVTQARLVHVFALKMRAGARELVAGLDF